MFAQSIITNDANWFATLPVYSFGAFFVVELGVAVQSQSSVSIFQFLMSNLGRVSFSRVFGTASAATVQEMIAEILIVVVDTTQHDAVGTLAAAAVYTGDEWSMDTSFRCLTEYILSFRNHQTRKAQKIALTESRNLQQVPTSTPGTGPKWFRGTTLHSLVREA